MVAQWAFSCVFSSVRQLIEMLHTPSVNLSHMDMLFRRSVCMDIGRLLCATEMSMPLSSLISLTGTCTFNTQSMWEYTNLPLSSPAFMPTSSSVSFSQIILPVSSPSWFGPVEWVAISYEMQFPPGCFVSCNKLIVPPDLSFAVMFEMLVEGIDCHLGFTMGYPRVGFSHTTPEPITRIG
jgi:hypothetical protein